MSEPETIEAPIINNLLPEPFWVRLARPLTIYAAVLVILVQYAALPIVAVIRNQAFEYMPEFAVIAVLVPAVTFILARTYEKMKGVA